MKHPSNRCCFARTYCDDADPISPEAAGQALVVTSDSAEKRFHREMLDFAPDDGGDGSRFVFSVDRSRLYQHILGWGGAFTDSTGFNIAKLSTEAQDLLIR